MKLQALATTLVRFIALFFSLLAFQGLVSGLLIRVGHDAAAGQYSWQPQFDLFQLALGIALWVLAPRIALLMQGGVMAPDIEATPDRLLKAGAFLLGLYWLIRSLPTALWTVFYGPGMGQGVLFTLVTPEMLTALMGAIVMLVSIRQRTKDSS
ncbi:hypothetical protein [Gimibacter soli]|uniref:Uncharacterized protein n=1 Tax=Gimibacter soli TaxID=3024400 RepID=A0AAE9XUV9_9PROT|nr:hypothetical protein [Gimibacter soli]WCL55085.1 hypothetical protein PH603_04850 [Gimibacter soli]